MFAKLRFRRPSHATVVAYLALFVALGGTSAYAANTVFSTDIVDGQVKTVDLGAAAVTEQKLADGAVTSDKFRDNNLRSRDVLNDSLTGEDINESSLRVGGLGGSPPALFAVVNASTGQANYGRGVINSQRVNTGIYEVTFNRSLARCATIATAGMGNPPAGGDTYQSGSTATLESANDRTVRVETTPSGGGGPTGGPSVPADRSFHLAVFC